MIRRLHACVGVCSWPTVLLAGLLAASGASITSAEEAGTPQDVAVLAEELAKVQGKWERTVRDAAGKTFRTVKQHKGYLTSVTTVDESGDTIAAHTSEFRLETRGAVRVFTYSNIKIVAGPDLGKEFKEGSSYIYAVNGGTFAEAHGLLIGDTFPVSFVLWTRVKE